jgi:hypothetical protein
VSPTIQFLDRENSTKILVTSAQGVILVGSGVLLVALRALSLVIFSATFMPNIVRQQVGDACSDDEAWAT